QGLSEKCYDVMLAFLRRHPKDRTLVAAADDTSALGALRAVRELRKQKQVMIVGQDCILEAINEMKVPGTPLVASVSHEAHIYGPKLVRIGLALLEGQRVSPVNYVEHRLVAAQDHLSQHLPA